MIDITPGGELLFQSPGVAESWFLSDMGFVAARTPLELLEAAHHGIFPDTSEHPVPPEEAADAIRTIRKQAVRSHLDIVGQEPHENEALNQAVSNRLGGTIIAFPRGLTALALVTSLEIVQKLPEYNSQLENARRNGPDWYLMTAETVEELDQRQQELTELADDIDWESEKVMKTGHQADVDMAELHVEVAEVASKVATLIFAHLEHN